MELTRGRRIGLAVVLVIAGLVELWWQDAREREEEAVNEAECAEGTRATR